MTKGVITHCDFQTQMQKSISGGMGLPRQRILFMPRKPLAAASSQEQGGESQPLKHYNPTPDLEQTLAE